MGDFESPADVADDVQGEAGGSWSYAGRNLHYGVREVGSQIPAINADRFGVSAPGEKVMHEHGFNVDHVCQKVTTLLEPIKEERMIA
jgi:transketolase